MKQLTKTLVLENTRYVRSDAPSSVYYAQYYAVVVQYVAKIQTETLARCLREAYNAQFPRHRRSKQEYSLQWAPEEVSQQLTGFPHNGVSPFGCPKNMPVRYIRFI